MKKILSLMICLIIAASTLVGCFDPEIGDHYGDFPPIVKDEGKVTLEMYIIGAEDSTKNTLDTVKRMISQHTETTYNTILNISYFSLAEYEQSVKAAIDNGTVDIVLINSENLFDEVSDNLVDMTDYLKLKKYGTLQKLVPASLWSATKLGDKTCVVPNNRIVGEYQYLVIDRACAERYFNYSENTLKTYRTAEDCAELLAKIANDDIYKNNASELVKFVSGSYADKAKYEANDKICNIIEYPTITREEALEAGFAITKSCEKPERAMEIISAINTDVTLRNRLQYGYENSNYQLVDGYAVKDTDPNNKYEMNILYTGNIFTAYYNDQYNWNADVATSGAKQNQESVYFAE